MEEKKIDGVHAIYDYTHCGEIDSCEKCECHKKIEEFETFDNLCKFLRTYTAVVRGKIDEVLNKVL